MSYFKNHLLKHSLNMHEALNGAFSLSPHSNTQTHTNQVYIHIYTPINNSTKGKFTGATIKYKPPKIFLEYLFT